MGDTPQHPLLEVIRRRYTAEDFRQDRGLDERELRQLVEDAAQAPSSFNIQHWRFVVVRRPEDKERLRAAAFGQPQVVSAPATFIVLGDTRAEERLPEILDLAVARGAIAEGKAAAWIRMARQIYADERMAREEAIRSASLAAMILMLAAEARGLAAGALSGFDPEQVRRDFAIAERYVPVLLLCVGYPARPAGPRMPRLPVEDLLRFDRWR